MGGISFSLIAVIVSSQTKANLVKVEDSIKKKDAYIEYQEQDRRNWRETYETIKNQNSQQQKEIERLNKEIENLKAAKQQRLAASSGSTRRVSAPLSVEHLRPLVSRYDWNVDEALLVISRESGGDPNAVSATNDYGLFQIHNGLQEYGDVIFNPEFNTKIANDMYSSRGWRPWYAVQGILW